MIFSRSVLGLFSFTSLCALAAPTTAPNVAAGLNKRDSVTFDAALKAVRTPALLVQSNIGGDTNLIPANIYFQDISDALKLVITAVQVANKEAPDSKLGDGLGPGGVNSVYEVYEFDTGSLAHGLYGFVHRRKKYTTPSNAPILQTISGQFNVLRKVTQELAKHMAIAIPEEPDSFHHVGGDDDDDDEDEKLASRAFGDLHDQVQDMNRNLQESIDLAQRAI